MNRACLLVGPSLSGKNTLLAELPKYMCDPILFPTSCTTRSPRVGENDGEHYYFLLREEFERKIELEEFAEWAVVHGELYGTLESELDRVLQSDGVVCFDVDIQGAKQIKEQMPETVVIFIAPGSVQELRGRFESDPSRRGTEASLETRLQNAIREMREIDTADYWISNRNDFFHHALFELTALLRRLDRDWPISAERFQNPGVLKMCKNATL